MFNQQEVCIIGMGYIGLPLATFLAGTDHKVVGIDVDDKKIAQLKKGIPTIQEKGFDKFFTAALNLNNLSFSKTPQQADIFIIAVQTPLNHEINTADLSYVKTAIESIIPVLNSGNLIIIESTIPPLTCRNFVMPLIRENLSKGLKLDDIHIAHCPERAFPGNLIHEFIFNNRIIGGVTPIATKKAKLLYSSFVKGKIYETDDVTAETVKLVENSFRDINIAYANELQLICSELNVEVHKVIQLANEHPRVNILKPGIGVGGNCIAIDPWFLWQVSPEKAVLIKTARKINDSIPDFITKMIQKIVLGIPKPKIVTLGKSYKPNVVDTWESPSLKINSELMNMGYEVLAVDPLTDKQKSFSLIDLAKGADLLVVLVEHDIIKHQLEKDIEKIKQVMNHPFILRF